MNFSQKCSKHYKTDLLCKLIITGGFYLINYFFSPVFVECILDFPLRMIQCAIGPTGCIVHSLTILVGAAGRDDATTALPGPSSYQPGHHLHLIFILKQNVVLRGTVAVLRAKVRLISISSLADAICNRPAAVDHRERAGIPTGHGPVAATGGESELRRAE